MTNNDNFKSNEEELMKYYELSGGFGKLKLRLKFVKSWIYHSLAYSSPLPSWSIKFQKSRGVKVGENCHFSPYV